MNITILIHIYYDDTLLSIYKRIRPLLRKYPKTQIIINVPYDFPLLKRLSLIISKKMPNTLLIKSSNIGKDIGGKLILFHTYLKLNMNSNLLLFLHDKKSPQTIIGEQWSNQLYNIVKEDNIETILELFNDPDTGMVGDKKMIFSKRNKSEQELFAGNKEIVHDLARKYQLKSKDNKFIGGTMFWVRESIFKDFFTKYNPMEIRQDLEKGNVLDDLGPTFTHSWERLFGWIITNYGFKIKGI